MQFIEDLKKKGHLVAYVGDVVGTGSSRKSATNSIIWGTGVDIPFVPNKRFGGVTLGGKIAPIFFNTQEDSGALPIEVDVSKLEMGDVIDVLPYAGKIVKNGETVAEFHQVRRAAGRSASRRPYQPDHRPFADRQGSRSPGSARIHRVPPAPGSCCF